MNCEPDEMAVIVSDCGGSGLAGLVAREVIGRVVRVTTYGPPRWACAYEMVWRFEEPLYAIVHGEKYVITGCADEALRPIRDQPGDDETLTWAGKPADLTAPVPQKVAA